MRGTIVIQTQHNKRPHLLKWVWTPSSHYEKEWKEGNRQWIWPNLIWWHIRCLLDPCVLLFDDILKMRQFPIMFPSNIHIADSLFFFFFLRSAVWCNDDDGRHALQGSLSDDAGCATESRRWDGHASLSQLYAERDIFPQTMDAVVLSHIAEWMSNHWLSSGCMPSQNHRDSYSGLQILDSISRNANLHAPPSNPKWHLLVLVGFPWHFFFYSRSLNAQNIFLLFCISDLYSHTKETRVGFGEKNQNCMKKIRHVSLNGPKKKFFF